VHTDPLRVIEAVVAGIAFLGAGAIIQGRGQVTGITTGASMWVAGAIGIASGLGYYALATATTLFAIIVLYILGKLEARMKSDKPSNEPVKPGSHRN
jgi:putative Mg2+ transporter-C (MgtC) family protein